MSKKNKKAKKNEESIFLWMSIEAYENIGESWSSAYVGVCPTLEGAKEAALDSFGVEDAFVVFELTNAPMVKYEIEYVATPVTGDE